MAILILIVIRERWVLKKTNESLKAVETFFRTNI
jgi:hypothetical protein